MRMKNAGTTRGAARLAMALALAVCVGNHAQAQPGEALAELEAHPTELESPRRGEDEGNFVFAFGDESCTPKPPWGKVVAYSTIRSDTPVKGSFPAGARVYLRATVAAYATGPSTINNTTVLYEVGKSYCTRLVSFVAVAGRRYTLQQNGNRYACPMNVVDTQTGYAPPDLRAHPVSRSCSFVP